MRNPESGSSYQNSFHDVEWIKTVSNTLHSQSFYENQNSFHDVEWIKTLINPFSNNISTVFPDQNSFHDVEWIKTQLQQKELLALHALYQNSFHDVEWIKTQIIKLSTCHIRYCYIRIVSMM